MCLATVIVGFLQSYITPRAISDWEEWFEKLPKMKYSKEQIQRLTKPTPTTTPRQIGHIEELVRPSSPVAENTPITITRYCNNCGQETQFKRDALGYMTCTACREQAPDRSGRAD